MAPPDSRNLPAPRRIIDLPRRIAAREWGGTETLILEPSLSGHPIHAADPVILSTSAPSRESCLLKGG